MPDGAIDFGGQTVSAARRTLQSVLAAAGVDDANREARLLIEYATGLTPERLLLDPNRGLSASEALRLRGALHRRLAHEPLSRIRGERDFYGRTFDVTPAVLDPRPDTETLIDLVLEWVDQTGGRQRPLSLLDIGTGSGCVLITLLAELPHATGLGSDISQEALDVARGNAARHGVAARAGFQKTRSLDSMSGPFDILVSNPPYIPTAHIVSLEPAVRGFEPMIALDGGPDGLAIYREIATRAGTVVPSGLIAMEVGAGQATDVARILSDLVENRHGAPWTRADLGGHARAVALLTHR